MLLEVRCNRCSRATEFEVACATVYPKVMELPESEAWDGILLWRIFDCPECAAQDEYELTPASNLRIMEKMLESGVELSEDTDIDDATAPYEPEVLVGEARLWDGTLVKRPVQGIARLRELTRKHPASGQAWRRLGNFCQRCECWQEAESAWRKAVEIDEHEVEAAYSLAKHFWCTERYDEAMQFVAETLQRYPREQLEPEVRQAIAWDMSGMLRQATEASEDTAALVVVWNGGRVGRHEVVNTSGVDVRKIRRWDRLAELLASGAVHGVGITSDLPDEEPTRLQMLLESSGPMDLTPVPPPGALGRERRELRELHSVAHADARAPRKGRRERKRQRRKQKSK